MKSKYPLVSAAVVAICGALSSQAQAGIEDHVTFSGFGTFGGVVTNTDDVNFRRDQQPDGATKTIDTGVDTNLGVQVNIQANKWLSATVQGLAMKRDVHEKEMAIEWAFVKVAPLPGLSVRAGRMAMPTFLVSDSRNVGYANTWLRAPNEVYGLALLPLIDGGDVTYTHELGKVRLTGTLMAGQSGLASQGTSIAVKGVKGGNLQMQMGPVTARVGKLYGYVQLGVGLEDKYSFNGIGVSYDKDKILAQAEYVQRRSSGYYNSVSADGWYLMGGYRLGAFTPYGIVSSTKPVTSSSEPPSAFGHLSEKQKSMAVGVRWDATSFASLKFQVERADTDGTSGISFAQAGSSGPGAAFVVDDPVNVISATVDFVF